MKNKFSTVLFLFATIFFIIFLTPISVNASTANIKNLFFTNEIRTVKPGEISKDIIVQTQNDSGVAEKIDETNDVTFTSTSPTGQFLSSSGNPVSTTMSKNTSSRTFYYKDSTLGDYSITVTIKGRDTGKTFSATQEIIVSDVVPTDTTTSTSTGDTSTDTSTSTSTTDTTSSSSDLSAHSSQTSISEISEKFDFKTDAGRKRIGTLDAPLEFDAKISETSKTYGSVSFNWSFGDGSSAVGKKVSHQYSFTGDYVVVLNTVIDGNDAVSRTDVKIIKPDLAITDFKLGENGFVEIKNNSAFEINLGGWEVKAASSTFAFAKDTIIKSKAIVKFPTNLIVSGVPNINLELIYPDEQVAIKTENNVGLVAMSEIKKQKIINELESKLATIQKEISDQIDIKKTPIPIAQDEQVLPKEISSIADTTETKINQNLEQDDNLVSTSTGQSGQKSANATASLVEAFDEHPENKSFINKILSFPKEGIDFVKNLFVY